LRVKEVGVFGADFDSRRPAIVERGRALEVANQELVDGHAGGLESGSETSARN
jgi:hypothetical protein